MRLKMLWTKKKPSKEINHGIVEKDGKNRLFLWFLCDMEH